MTGVDPRAPVIVGAGQISNGGTAAGDNAVEPLDPVSLAAEAARRAAADSGGGAKLLGAIDSVRCLGAISAHHHDLGALVAAELDAAPRQTVQTVVGGNGPQSLVNDTAAAIAAGELDVALIAGAEAFASLRAGTMPQREAEPAGAEPTILGAERVPCTELETAVGLVAPVYVYGLIETALRARLGLDREAHLERVAGLWSRFSEIAAGNPHAWLARAHTPEEIATPTGSNRLVSAPYSKLMTANIGVDQGAALILCSAEAAERAGVPRDRWVFVWSGAEAQDEWFVSDRPELACSPAVAACGRAVLEHAGLTIDEIGLVDLYSCFPVAVQVAAAELGLELADPARPLTVTGGLTFAGGPGNNYSTHAIATMVGRLREEPEAHGLVSALGWYLTKHAVGVYSGQPPATPFRALEPEPQLPAAQRVAEELSGTATIEAYTVPCDREGEPEAAILSVRTEEGSRGLLRSGDPDLKAAVTGAEEPLGRTITVGAGGAVEAIA